MLSLTQKSNHKKIFNKNFVLFFINVQILLMTLKASIIIDDSNLYFIFHNKIPIAINIFVSIH